MHSQLTDFSKSEDGMPTESSPPKPPRSAFICFSDAKKDELMGQSNLLNQQDILNAVAQEWRKLSSQERAEWDEAARNDKVRYVREKAVYKGPPLEPKRRAKKHPLAPKRPMSAFLKFSKVRRAEVKGKNPDMSNTDISRLLGEIWRNASPKERAPFIETELVERSEYKEKIRLFREQQATLDDLAQHRSSHSGQLAPLIPDCSLTAFPEDPMEPLRIDAPTQFSHLEGISKAFSFDDCIMDPGAVTIGEPDSPSFFHGINHSPRDRGFRNVFEPFFARESQQVTPEDRQDRWVRQSKYFPPPPPRRASYRSNSPAVFFYPVDSYENNDK